MKQSIAPSLLCCFVNMAKGWNLMHLSTKRLYEFTYDMTANA